MATRLYIGYKSELSQGKLIGVPCLFLILAGLNLLYIKKEPIIPSLFPRGPITNGDWPRPRYRE